MSAIARMLSGLAFLALGLNQIFHFKVAHERVLNHMHMLVESTKGILGGFYHVMSGMAPIVVIIAAAAQILVGISLLFSYRMKLILKSALCAWVLFIIAYFPFYLFRGTEAFMMVSDIGFVLCQIAVMLFCLSRGKKPAPRMDNYHHNEPHS